MPKCRGGDGPIQRLGRSAGVVTPVHTPTRLSRSDGATTIEETRARGLMSLSLNDRVATAECRGDRRLRRQALSRRLLGKVLGNTGATVTTQTPARDGPGPGRHRATSPGRSAHACCTPVRTSAPRRCSHGVADAVDRDRDLRGGLRGQSNERPRKPAGRDLPCVGEGTSDAVSSPAAGA